MIADTIKWFHQVMGHHGERRLHETLNQQSMVNLVEFNALT
jgi:hypothetical protein